MTPRPNNVVALDDARRVLFEVRKAVKALDVDDLLSVLQHIARLRDRKLTKATREAARG